MIQSIYGRFLAACVVCVAVCPVASAGNLTLSANDLTWDWSVAPTVSPPLAISVANDTSPDSDLLQGWQLRLQIEPVNAVGTLFFHSGDVPANYLLDGVSGGLVASPGGLSLFAFDDDETFQGVEVPASGTALINLTFDTFNGALGEFRLVAVPGLANTEWSDSDFNDRPFTDLPLSGGGLIELATINVVPEPGSFFLLGLGLLVLLAVRLRGLAAVAIPSIRVAAYCFRAR